MLGLQTIALFASLTTTAHAGPNSAVTHEINWELDAQMMNDESWDTFSWGSSLNTWGVSGGYGINRNLTMMVGLHHRKYVNNVDIYSEGDNYEYTYNALETSLSATQLSVGPKLSAQLTPWLRPYATAKAVAWVGIMGADDNSYEDDNLNQLKWRSVSPGLEAAAGFDVVPLRKDRVHFATHLDIGYAAALNFNFSDDAGTIHGTSDPAPVGTLPMRGLQINWGVGVHF